MEKINYIAGKFSWKNHSEAVVNGDEKQEKSLKSFPLFKLRSKIILI